VGRPFGIGDHRPASYAGYLSHGFSFSVSFFLDVPFHDIVKLHTQRFGQALYRGYLRGVYAGLQSVYHYLTSYNDNTTNSENGTEREDNAGANSTQRRRSMNLTERVYRAAKRATALKTLKTHIRYREYL
jgi:hypothetical protein